MLFYFDMQTVWGSPNTSIAERRMLREALKEPRNQRFLLLSDTGVPLYPPTVVWQQLMSETKSRIDACSHVRMTPHPLCAPSQGIGGVCYAE